MRARTQDSNNLNYVRVKVKVKAFILSTPRCIEGVEGQLQLFLTSALNVSEGLGDLSLRTDPSRLNRRVRGHSADFDVLERRHLFSSIQI